MKQSNRHQVQFLAWLEKMSSDLNKAGRLGTARNYRKALNSFSQFLCESGVQSLVWPDESTILKYNSWLQYRGIVRNSISFYMRILRSACNKAAAHGIIPPDQLFSKVYTGVDKTRKRAVDEKLIASLLDMDLSCSHALAMTRDMFIFSYCTRGMAFIDMAMLKQDNIRGDILVYNRKKTGQRLSVRIEDRTREIIKRYSRPDSGYIFPILGDFPPETKYRRYQTALGYYNRNLKRLCRIAGSEARLSSYTARHSWASSARKHHIPISVISAGMGHDSEKTTMIYLSSLESSAVDNANRKILSSLGKAGQEH